MGRRKKKAEESRRISGFCTACGWKVESFAGLEACPQCGSTGVPCADKDQVKVSVNWHELHLLCVWAENWAIQVLERSPNEGVGRGTVYAIAERLQDQYPGGIKLTLAGAVNKLRDAGWNIRTDIPGEER